MGRKKSNPNAELEGLPQEVDKIDSSSVPVSLLKVLESPYEPGSLEDNIFTLCKESHATIDELATILCLDRDYLATEMKDVISKGYTACKIILRRQQFASANSGDSKQLTWLGKQVLGQEDKTTLDMPINITIATGITRNPVRIIGAGEDDDKEPKRIGQGQKENR